jgi:threonine aldolase
VLAALPAFTIDPEAVETNIVIFETNGALDAASVVDTLESEHVLMTVFGPRTVRATLHHDVTDAGFERAVAALREHFG